MAFTLCILVPDNLKNIWFSHISCRMVSEKRFPYMNIHEAFPAEMRLFGKDVQFFNVRVRKTNLVWISSVVKQCAVFLIALTTSGLLQYLPSYSLVHKEAVILARILQLPSFPTVSQDCLLHPFPLTVRYLLEANLPSGCFCGKWCLKIWNKFTQHI